MFRLTSRLKTDLLNRVQNGRLNDFMAVNRLAPGVSEVTDEDLDKWIAFRGSECKAGRRKSYFK